MTLLIFPPAGGRQPGWWRVDESGISGRGAGWPAVDPAERIVLAAPGEDVALHWIDLPALAPNQARAAARIAAADVVAAPGETLHVAVAAGRGAGVRPMAVVAQAAMAGWLADAAAHGIEPHAIVPEPLLLPVPAEGEHHWTVGERVVVRGVGSGHVADPALAAMLAEPPAVPLDEAAVAVGLAERLDAPGLDLRQGPFARRRRLGLDMRLVRRLGVLAGAILLVTLAHQLVLIARYRIEASRAEARAAAVAQAVLPRATRIADPAAQLAARLAELRGGGLGFSTMAAAIAQAVQETGGVELTALAYDGSGRITATAAAPGPAEIDALVARLEAAGLDASASAPRAGGTRPLADLTVSVR